MGPRLFVAMFVTKIALSYLVDFKTHSGDLQTRVNVETRFSTFTFYFKSIIWKNTFLLLLKENLRRVLLLLLKYLKCCLLLLKVLLPNSFKNTGKKMEIWKVKGKVMDTNTGGSPGYHSQTIILDTHLVPSLFEALCLSIATPRGPVTLLTVYRPTIMTLTLQ